MIKSEKKDVLAIKTPPLATRLKKFLKKRRKNSLNTALVNAVKVDDSFLIEIASEYGDTKIVELLIDNGADVTVNNNYPIRIASKKGYTKIVKLLIDAGADVTADNNYPIRVASEYGHTDVVKLLIDAGADVTINGNYPIRIAFAKRYTEIVKLLLIDADIDVTDELIKSLYNKSTYSSLEVFDLLVIALEKKKTDKIK